MDEKSYLEDGFDPKSLKVASLRGILNEHKVSFPSNAKKQDLINIFNSNIKPQAKSLLDSYKDSIGNSNGEGFENIVTKEETKPKSRARSKTPKQKTPTPVSSSVSPKEESSSSFTNDNVFQSSQGTSERHKKSRKRSHPEEKGTPTNKKKVKAKSTDNEKSIFDDSSDYSEIGNSFSEATTARRSKTPEKYSETTVGKKLKSDSKIKTSPKIHGSSPSAAHLSNEDTVVQNMDSKTKISSVKTPQSKVPSQKNTPKKKDATPKRTPKRTPVKSPKSNSVKKSAKEEGVETNKFDKYTSLEKEASNYDRQLKMIKEKESNKLASDLGIKIQGLPSQNFVLNKDTIELPKKKAAGPSLESSLKPRRRIIPEPTLDSLEASDDDKDLGSESEVEEDHRASSFEDNLNKIKTNLRADFAKINRSISGRKTSSGIVFGFIFLWFILISAGLFGYWYREQTIMIGYCGEEIDVPTFSKSEGMPSLLVSMGDYLDANFKPSCKPCPPHARCFPYLEIGCYEDFMEAKPWFAMINPSLKTCVPDTRKAEKLETMIDVALDMLRSKNAQRNCGTAPKEDLEAGISVDTLHDLLFLIKAPYITTEEFEDLWNRSVVELQKEPEIITGYWLNNIPAVGTNIDNADKKAENKVFRSISLSNISMKCHLQNSLFSTLIRYRLSIFLGLFFGLSMKILSIKLKKRKTENIKVEIVFNEVLKKLSKQKKISLSNSLVPSYIGSTHLRDLILSNEKNLTAKMNFWNKVTKKVEYNSNVRSKLIENHGEIMKVWEWISDIDIDN